MQFNRTGDGYAAVSSWRHLRRQDGRHRYWPDTSGEIFPGPVRPIAVSRGASGVWPLLQAAAVIGRQHDPANPPLETS
jgi:hypothetical protein